MNHPSITLLMHAIRSDREAALSDAARLLEKDGIADWSYVSLLALWNEVRPSLYALLKGLPPRLVPDTVLEEFRAECQHIAVQQMAMAGEFLRLQDALAQVGIRSVPIKGFWLSHVAYGRLAARECSDLDLYIQRNDLEGVARVMHNLGYAPTVGMESYTGDRIFRELGNYTFDKMEGERRLYHVEFHWTLGNNWIPLDIDWAHLEPCMGPQVFQGREVLTLSPSAILLLATLHHGAKEYWRKLKQVEDIAQLLNSKGNELDWGWIMAQAHRIRAVQAVLTGLSLANRLCGVPVPECLAAQVAAPRIQRLADSRIFYFSHPETWFRKIHYLQHLAYLVRTRDGFRMKCRMVGLLLFVALRRRLDLLFHRLFPTWRAPKTHTPS